MDMAKLVWLLVLTVVALSATQICSINYPDNGKLKMQ